MSSTKFETNAQTTFTTTYRSYFTPTDESIPYRLVGSFEYLKSLEEFTNLVQNSSEEELKIYDEVLNERGEFSFFHGIHSAFEQKPDLTKANPFQRKAFNDKFKKQGLKWMMALARIELAATSSLYGEVDHPFEVISPTPFDLEAYVSILRDDVLAHMKSLAQEPGFKKVIVKSRTPDAWTLAYLRRIKLIRDMLSTLEKIGGPSVAEEISPLVYDLKKHQRNLVQQVDDATYVRTESNVVHSTSYKEREKVIGNSVGKCKQFVDQKLRTGPSAPARTPSLSPSPGGGSNLIGSAGQ